MFWNQYPYMNLNDLNLDYILAKIKLIESQLKNFIVNNTIKYANPIAWDITKQYGSNTVTIDISTGIAYLSVDPVPSGIAITNTDYWSKIFDLTEVFNDITAMIGDLDDLNTADKSSVVNAINSLIVTIDGVIATIGDLDDLNTSDKTSIVNALNSLVVDIQNVRSEIASIKLSFNNVADMINGSVEDGEVYRCDGYYVAGDNGFSFWLCSAEEPSIFHVAASNGLYLRPLPLNCEYNCFQFGAYGDDSHDDTEALQSFIETVETTKINGKIGTGTFKITSALIISGRNITIVGAGLDATTIKRYYDVSNTDYHAIRLTGQYNWGLTLGNFTLTQDHVGHGAGICFGDGVSDVGGTYHSIFKPISFNYFQYGLFVESTTTSFWGCKFEYLIFTEITWDCINNVGLGGGIPNNLFEHITTYRCGLPSLQRTAQFNIRGYNQKIINLEVLHPVTTIFVLASGSYLKIDNFKIEDAAYDTANGTTYIALLNPYSELDVDYYYLIGNFTNVNNLVTYSTSSGEATFNINNLFHYYESGATPIAAICSGSYIKGRINDTMIMQNMPFNYSSDVNIKNGLLESGATLSTGTNATVEPSKVKTILNPTNNSITITINNDPANRSWSSGSNLTIDVINAGTGTITVNDYAGNTIGTIAASTKKKILLISSGLYIPYI